MATIANDETTKNAMRTGLPIPDFNVSDPTAANKGDSVRISRIPADSIYPEYDEMTILHNWDDLLMESTGLEDWDTRHQEHKFDDLMAIFDMSGDSVSNLYYQFCINSCTFLASLESVQASAHCSSIGASQVSILTQLGVLRTATLQPSGPPTFRPSDPPSVVISFIMLWFDPGLVENQVIPTSPLPLMVKLAIVRNANTALVAGQALIAVFVGGTSGIGESTVRALASAHAKSNNKGFRAYIVGRNKVAADKIIADCVQLCPSGQFQFVYTKDLALLANVDHACEEIMRREEKECHASGAVARIDLLFMSMACMPFGPRKETKEGLGTFLSLVYYARMRFILQLLPLLLASTLASAHIISVYAGGMEATLFPEDLSLRQPGRYCLSYARSHSNYMITLFMETLIEKTRDEGSLSFVHVFPGLVITNGFNDPTFPMWFKMIWRGGGAALARYFSVPLGESGERTLFLATSRFVASHDHEDRTAGKGDTVAIGANGNIGSGVYAVGANSEAIVTEKAYTKYRHEGLAQRVWDHTMKAFEDIEAGRVFTG